MIEQANRTLADQNRESLYSPFSGIPYKDVLPQVQAAVSQNLSRSVDTIPEFELRGIIRRYLTDHSITCDLSTDVNVIVEHIYHDMAGYSFISREGLLERDGFEELEINAWDDVEIVTHGMREKTNYAFLSSQHALDIILKILRRTETPFDIAAPRATAELSSGVRIVAHRPPVIDEERGVSADIRRVNLRTTSRDVLLSSGTITEEMMTFLELCLTHGVSICFSGETGSGKTTLAGALLSHAAAHHKRIFTIEEGSREWDLVRRDSKTGKIVTSVIHTKTRLNEKDPSQNVGQEELVKDSLRYDPDIIAPGEIRGREAFEVMGVSNTGHAVITTVHANGTLDTPERIVTLAKKAYDMTDNTLYSMCARAFPLLVHMDLGQDRVRRVVEIREVHGFSGGVMSSQLLYEYSVEDNLYEGDTCVAVKGEFRRVGRLSENLSQRLLRKGARRSDLMPYCKEVKEK